MHIGARLKAILASTAVFALAEAVSRAVSFLVFPVLATIFSHEEFGALAVMTSLAAACGLVANLGLNNATHRFYAENEGDRNNQKNIVSLGVALQLAASIIAACACIALFSAVGGAMGRNWSIWLVLAAFFSVVPTQLIQFCLDTIRLHAAPWRYALLAIGRTIFMLGFGLWLVVGLRWGLEGYFVGLLIGQMILIPLALYFIRSELVCSPSLSHLRPMLSYGIPFVFVGGAQWMVSSSDVLVISALRGDGDAGIYAVAQKFATLVTFSISAFALAWGPASLRLQKSDPNYREILGDGLIRLGTAFLYMGATVAFFGREAVETLTPPAYHSAIVPLAALVLSSSIAGTMQITVLGMAYAQRSDLMARVAWGVAGAGIPLVAGFVVTWGLPGAAIANMVVSVCLSGAYLAASQRVHPINVQYSRLAKLGGLYVLVLVLAFEYARLEIGLASIAIKLITLLVLVLLARFFDMSPEQAIVRKSS